MSESAQARLYELLSNVPPYWHALYQECFWEGYEEGLSNVRLEIAGNLIRLTSYDDQVIANLVGLEVAQVRELKH